MASNFRFKKTEVGMIPEDWDFEALDEFVSWITYGFTCPMPTAEDGPYMITATDLEGNKINYDSARRTTLQAFDERLTDKSRPQPNDVLLSKDGTLGRVALVDNRKVCIAQSVALLRPNDRIAPSFLYYLLLAPQYQRKMETDSDGTTIKHIYITRVNKMEVAVPKEEEQLRIVDILSTLDSKIETDQQIDESLEAMGQAIFKHWFVDFEFSNEEGKPYKSSGGDMTYNEGLGKEIPRNWVAKPIDEVANFLNGLAMQNYPAERGIEFLPVIKIRELHQGITDSSDTASPNIPKEYVVVDGDVLFSWSGSLKVVIWTSGRGALNQHLFKVSSEHYPKWYYYYWLLHHLPEYKLIAEGKATTMGHIQRHHLSDSLVLVPDDATLRRMDKVLGPVLDRQIQLGIESRNLSQIRDVLLPRLISGRIRIPFEAA